MKFNKLITRFSDSEQSNILDSSRGHIRGRVIDDFNAGVENARVKIENSDSYAFTDSRGCYVIINVKPGIYTIVAEHTRYSAGGNELVHVKAGDNPDIDFTVTNKRKFSIEAFESEAEMPMLWVRLRATQAMPNLMF